MSNLFWKNLHLCFSSAPQSKQTHTDPTIKNFNTLYDISKDDHHSSPPDFATVFASQRFFFSSPGRSNSIIDSTSSSSSSLSSDTTTVPLEGGVAVNKYSPDPYRDFRASMVEMIEAKNLKDVINDWDLLHELLFCYLSLNPKHTHNYIIRAFADILVSL